MAKNSLARFLYTKVLRWKYVLTVPDYDKCVICAAPHTSNWDFIIGKLFYSAVGRRTYFLMKKEWFVFPLGVFFRWIGGIPVYRSKNTSMVQFLVEKIKTAKRISIAITPEGTRKPNSQWKKGFYYAALDAHVPIVLIGIDYAHKVIDATRTFMPTGNYEADIKEIKEYFLRFRGKYPDNFSI